MPPVPDVKFLAVCLTAGCLALCGSGASLSYADPGGVEAVVLADLAYSSRDGRDLLADVYVPSGPGPFPIVITLHSGSWQRGSRGRMADVASDLQKAGFVAMNIEYSLAPRSPFPAQIEDARAAVRWIRANARRFRADERFVGAFGYSAGGHLALLLATDAAPDSAGRIQAVVAGAAPTDLELFPDLPSLKRVFGSSREEAPDVFKNASPITHVSPDDPPTFLYHGSYDWIVSPDHSRRMAERLRRAKVPVEYLELPLGHARGEICATEQVRPAIAFLRKWIGGGNFLRGR